MRVGIHFVNFTLPGAPETLGPTLATTARIAEESGVSVFTLMDHWFQMEMMATSEDPMLEGYTSLGFLAGHTDTMTLGLLVTGVTYRHPGLLAKIVTTLDVLSGGRAQLGIGAAWYEREHRGLGVPVPTAGRALRTTRGDAADLPADVERRLGALPGSALPARRDHLLATADQLAAPPHPRRRQWRTKDVAARGPLRRCLQPVRDLSRRDRPQARRPRPPL